VLGLRIQPGRIRLFSHAMAITAFVDIFLCQLAIWLAPSLRNTGQGLSMHDNVVSIVDDLAILLAVIITHALFSTILPRGKRLVHGIFAIAYFMIAMLQTLNVVMLVRTGTSFDISLISYLNPTDSGTVLPTIAALQSPRLFAFMSLCLGFVPVLSWAILRKIFWPEVGTILTVSALLLVAGITSELSPASPPQSGERQASINPILLSLKLFYSSNGPALALQGKYDLDPDTSPQMKNVRTGEGQNGLTKCCPGMNIVLITIDSVPYHRASRDVVMAFPDDYPALADLYRRGTTFDNFYTVFPSSTPALISIIASVPPIISEFQPSVRAVNTRPATTLASVLTAQGYRTALFMSGELRYANVDSFLANKGFQTLQDSNSLKCGSDDEATMAIYSHKGDACTAKYTENWLVTTRRAAPEAPFFLWTWFTNPHAPYFTKANATSTGYLNAKRQGEALQETDAAIASLMTRLKNEGLLQSTIIVLSSDHGEAFGEHGYKLHGGSLFEEQVHVPMILVVPGMSGNIRETKIGSTLDIAPTLISLVGGQVPRIWQGHNLFSTAHPNRAYFTKTSGGIALGIRRENRKIIISAQQERPYYFDLTTDPLERRALHFGQKEEHRALREVSNYVRESAGQ
jgi:lipoteichoic acid synthase